MAHGSVESETAAADTQRRWTDALGVGGGGTMRWWRFFGWIVAFSAVAELFNGNLNESARRAIVAFFLAGGFTWFRKLGATSTPVRRPRSVIQRLLALGLRLTAVASGLFLLLIIFVGINRIHEADGTSYLALAVILGVITWFLWHLAGKVGHWKDKRSLTIDDSEAGGSPARRMTIGVQELVRLLNRSANVPSDLPISTAERDDIKFSLARIDEMDGEEFERWLAARFERAGFSVDKVGQGGSDQGGDLILKSGETRVVVQAKRYNSNVGNRAVQEAYAAGAYYRADFAWVVTNSTFTRSATELANRTGVGLFGREQLAQWVRGNWPFPIDEPYSGNVK